MMSERTGPVEFADKVRTGSGTFPEHWLERSWPAGSPYSEKRARWIRDQIIQDGGGSPYQTLAAKATRLRMIALRAELLARRR
jgi:hypothetical protein